MKFFSVKAIKWINSQVCEKNSDKLNELKVILRIRLLNERRLRKKFNINFIYSMFRLMKHRVNEIEEKSIIFIVHLLSERFLETVELEGQKL